MYQTPTGRLRLFHPLSPICGSSRRRQALSPGPRPILPLKTPFRTPWTLSARILISQLRSSMICSPHSRNVPDKAQSMKRNRYYLAILFALSTFALGCATFSTGCGLISPSHHRTEDYTPVVAAATAGDLATVRDPAG